jgi:plasmid stabilization system protein ParE
VRLAWDERALDDIEHVAERAARGAADVHESILRLLRSPFPGMFRRVQGRPRDHVLVVNPYVVLYRVEGDSLIVLRVLDGRRERWLR